MATEHDVSDEPTISAWRMQLNPGQASVYKKRHDEIWPELASELRKAGVVDFYIYLDPTTHSLFAHLVAAPSNALDDMRDKEIMWKWWRMMADIMDTNPDCSPREWELIPMFHLSAKG